VTNGYEVGEISYLSLLTAQRTYFQTSLQYLDAMREAWAADVQIKGFLLSGQLNSSPVTRVLVEIYPADKRRAVIQ